MSSSTSRALAFALLSVVLVFSWQALTVHLNYGGNWTALFCTGDQLKVPPELDSEGIYRFPDAIGYDGQFYHYQAHDPFLRRGFAAYQDAPRLRYRRMLVPIAAYLLAFGQDRFIDTALLAVIWITVFFGVYWSGRWAALDGWHPAWGLAFLLVPATIVAIDRTIVDATLAALCVGLALYARRGSAWKIYAILALAALTRETGWLLAAGYGLYLISRRASWKAAAFATSVAPSLLWTSWVTPRTKGDIGTLTPKMIWGALKHPQCLVPGEYRLPQPQAGAMHALDYLMVAGSLLAIVLALWSVWKKPRHAESFAALGFAGLMVVTVFLVTQHDPFTWARLSSPLLALLALHGARRRQFIFFVPLLLVALRTSVQLAPQLLGILRGIALG